MLSTFTVIVVVAVVVVVVVVGVIANTRACSQLNVTYNNSTGLSKNNKKTKF
jgi:hypothetical protein